MWWVGMRTCWYCFAPEPVLLSVSRYWGCADHHLLLVIHLLWISSSYNPNSKHQNYPFKYRIWIHPPWLILNDVTFILQGSGRSSFLYVICDHMWCDSPHLSCSWWSHGWWGPWGGDSWAAELLLYCSQMNSVEHNGALHELCWDCWESIPAGLLHEYILLYCHMDSPTFQLWTTLKPLKPTFYSLISINSKRGLWLS